MVKILGWIVFFSFWGCSTSYQVVEDGQIQQKLFQKILKETAQIRGLKPLLSVKAEVKTKADLQHYLKEELALEYPEGKLLALERAYQTMGMMGEGISLEKQILRIYEEEVAGFYDPKKKEFYLLDHAVSTGILWGILQFLLQKDIWGEMLVSHEYTHALQDQHFDLVQSQKRAQNDDELLALSCLIEGDATATSLDYLLHSREQALTLSLEDLSGSLMEKVLLFKYLGGLAFVQSLLKNRGCQRPHV